MKNYINVFKYGGDEINVAYKAYCNELGVTDGVMPRYRHLFPILAALLVVGVAVFTSGFWLPPLSVDYTYNWIEVSAFMALAGTITWACTSICSCILRQKRRLDILERAGITVKKTAFTPSIRDLFRVRKEINRQYRAYCQRTGRKGYWLEPVINLSASLFVSLALPTMYFLGIRDPDMSLLDVVIPSCFAGVFVLFISEWLDLKRRWKLLQEDRDGAGDSQHHRPTRLRTLHTEVNDYLNMRPDFPLGMIFGLVIGMLTALLMVVFSPLYENVPVIGRPIAEQLLAVVLTGVGAIAGVVTGTILGWLLILLVWRELKSRPEAARAKYPAFDPAEGQNGHIQ